jgi:hypothetical protein
VFTEQDDSQTRLGGVTNELVADLARKELKRRSIVVVEQRPRFTEWDQSLTLYARAGATVDPGAEGKPEGVCAVWVQLQLQSFVALRRLLTGADHKGQFVYCSKAKVGIGSIGAPPPLENIISTMLTNCLGDYEQGKIPPAETRGGTDRE